MSDNAASIMTRNVVTAGPNDSVAHVARILSEHGISAVPVCNDQGLIVGMLSEGDLMRPFGNAHSEKRAWWLNLLAEGTDLAPSFLDYLRMDRRRARDLMTTPVITATAKTTVPELADLLARHDIKRVPITQDGRLLGIVSRADIVRAMARTPEFAA